MEQHKPSETQMETNGANIADTTTSNNHSESTMTDTQEPPNSVSPKTEHHQAPKISLRHRLKHFTFAWFLSTMSTGGLAIALAEEPHQFRGLYTIGLVIFILNIVLFIFLSACMLARSILYPSHMKRVFFHLPESFFVGSFFLSINVMLGCIQVYGITYGPGYAWLVDAMYVCYWVYAGLSLVNSIAQYWILMKASSVRPLPFTPAMFLAGYSAMLTGTVASLVAGSQDAERAEMIIVSGLAYQGFGWLISLVCIVYFVRFLLDKGLPPAQMRPGLFIPVGSAAYTIVVMIGLANAIPDAPASGYFARHPDAKEILRVVALFIGIFLWLFSFWMFAIAVLASLTVAGRMPFALTWWAFIFPNVGFTIATSMIGKELDSPAVLWVASVMTIFLVSMWLVSIVGCVRAVWLGKIAWPGKDEDKDL